MDPELTCGDVEANALVERYLARRLSADEETAFERHYLGCARCRDELALGAAVRAALRAQPAAAADASTATGAAKAAAIPLPRRRTRMAAAAAGLALAAGVTAVLLGRGERVSPAVARLGEVTQPPVYLGVPVRAAPAPGDTAFEAAMAAYAEGRYRNAAAGLERARAAGMDAAPAEFFRGASLLMLHRDDEAAQAFGRVEAAGATPYADEAHFYRAKALLRLGRAGEAAGELRRVTPRQDELSAWAAALADSIEAAAPR